MKDDDEEEITLESLKGEIDSLFENQDIANDLSFGILSDEVSTLDSKVRQNEKSNLDHEITLNKIKLSIDDFSDRIHALSERDEILKDQVNYLTAEMNKLKLTWGISLERKIDD